MEHIDLRFLYNNFKSIVNGMRRRQRKPRGVFFNKDIFCQGELLKIVINLDSELRSPKLQIFRAENKEKLVVYEALSETNNYDSTKYAYVDTKNLPEGPYIAELNNVDEQNGSLLKQFHFSVLGNEYYKDFWHNMFGEKWDQPIFWSDVEATEIAKLLHGLPLEDLWETLPQSTALNKRSFYELLGPITTALMTSESGPLPFIVNHKWEQVPSLFPHIDLIKLMWLISVLASVWADMVFFSSKVELSIMASEDTVTLFFETSDHCVKKENNKLFSVSPLYSIVQHASGIEDVFQMDLEMWSEKLNFNFKVFAE